MPVVLGPSFFTTSTRTKPCVAGGGNPHGSMRTVTHCAIIYTINAVMIKGSDGGLGKASRRTKYGVLHKKLLYFV